MYAEYKNIPVYRVQGCTPSTWIVHRVQERIRLYAEYKLSMSYDNESPEPDDYLLDTESLQPYPYTIPLLFI